MDHVSVTSSNIRSIGYDEATSTLAVEFHTGAVYNYANVPSSVHDALMAAPSVGKFLNTNIKPYHAATQE